MEYRAKFESELSTDRRSFSAAAVWAIVRVTLLMMLLVIEVAVAGDDSDQLSPGDCRMCTRGGALEVETGLDLLGSFALTFGWPCCSDRCDLESGDRGEIEPCFELIVCNGLS
jgi:hypothetical protein